MSASSPELEKIARNIERQLLSAFAQSSGKALALATGWSESKISRLFNEGDAQGVTDIKRIALLLAELQLAVYPNTYRVSDPVAVELLLGFNKFAASHLKLHHIMPDPKN